ncbi:MAG: hypothetical protein ACOCXM_05325 [Myxococcota bacterium]
MSAGSEKGTAEALPVPDGSFHCPPIVTIGSVDSHDPLAELTEIELGTANRTAQDPGSQGRPKSTSATGATT